MLPRVPCPMKSFATALLIVSGLLAGLGSLSACSTGYPTGGGSISRDAFPFESTSFSPKTVQLKDTRTGEVLWTYEIPVDRKLVVRFYPGRNPTNTEMPDEMRWEEWELGRDNGSLENKMPAPDSRYRRLDVFIRKAEPSAARAEAR